jgi:predicted glycosyltransferase
VSLPFKAVENKVGEAEQAAEMTANMNGASKDTVLEHSDVVERVVVMASPGVAAMAGGVVGAKVVGSKVVTATTSMRSSMLLATKDELKSNICTISEMPIETLHRPSVRLLRQLSTTSLMFQSFPHRHKQ